MKSKVKRQKEKVAGGRWSVLSVLFRSGILLFTIHCSLFTAAAQTTEFIYQGSLKNAGTPATGNYDFEFRLFDLLSVGTQQGSTLQRLNVAVANGIFTVTLDFGPGTLPGADRFLDIAVSTAGGGTFTPLIPRQRVNSAPYSVKSLISATADLATNSTQLGGVAANEYVVTTDPRMTDARAPTAGSSDYVQNRTTQQALADFNISGGGTVGGTLSANIVTASNRYNFGSERILAAQANNDALFVGIGAGAVNSLGINGVFVGKDAGLANTTGQANTFVGAFSGSTNTTGQFNTYVGQGAGFFATGSSNSIFGGSTGQNLTTGNSNSIFGVLAGNFMEDGNENSFFGRSSGAQNISGSQNAFFGRGAGSANTTGSNNTAIGAFTNIGTALTFATALGSGATVSTNNTVVIGRTSDTVQIPGSLNITGTATTNIFNTLTQYNIAGNRVLSIAGTNNFFAGVGAGQINTGSGNTFVGKDAGLSNTTGFLNSFFGGSSGAANTTGTYNSFFGIDSGLSNTLGDRNAFFGSVAGRSNTEGARNSFFGTDAGFANTTANDNAYFGFEAGKNGQTGFGNAFFGTLAGRDNTAANNAFFGSFAGAQNTSGGTNAFFGRGAGQTNTTSSGNSYFGYQAGVFATGASNSFFGSSAGGGNTSGSNNTFIGLVAGNTNTIGGNNTAVGRFADFSVNNLNFATAIGSGAVATASNTVVLGRNLDTVQIPGALNVTGTTTFSGTLGANIFNATTQYNIGGSRVLAASSLADNIFAGPFAGQANTSGDANALFGSQAGLANSSGRANTFVGFIAGVSNTLGDNNTFLGSAAGDTNSTGSRNTLVGSLADVSTNDLNYATAIGADAVVSSSNTVVLGRNLDTVQVPGNLNVTGTFTGNLNGASITNLSASNISSGTLDSARLGVVPVTKGGTGSAMQNFVDLTTAQTVVGEKTFINTISAFAVNSGTQYNIGGNGVLNAGDGSLVNATAVGTNAVVSQNNSLILGSNANVGIGTTAPQQLLHVNGEVLSTGNAAGLKFRARGSTSLAEDWVWYADPLNSARLFSSTAGNLLNVKPDGSVGIGITDPAFRLDVAGRLRFRQNTGSTGTLNSAGFWFYQNAVNADQAFVGMENDNSVGLYGNNGGNWGLVMNTQTGVTSVKTLGVAGNVNLCRNSLSEISTCSSSLRYKTNITRFGPGISFVDQLSPIAFDWKEGGMQDVGFGAEDIAKIDPRFVTYNDKGEIEGVKYDRLSVAFVSAFKEQQAEIDELKKELADKKLREKQQHADIESLKTIVCSIRPEEKICQK